MVPPLFCPRRRIIHLRSPEISILISPPNGGVRVFFLGERLPSPSLGVDFLPTRLGFARSIVAAILEPALFHSRQEERREGTGRD